MRWFGVVNDKKNLHEVSMAVIHIRANEDIESALRRFKKKCINEGLLIAYKNKMYFEKPSTIKRKKMIKKKWKAEKLRRKKEGRNRGKKPL